MSRIWEKSKGAGFLRRPFIPCYLPEITTPSAARYGSTVLPSQQVSRDTARMFFTSSPRLPFTMVSVTAPFTLPFSIRKLFFATPENTPFVPLPNHVNAKLCQGATAEEIAYVLDETGCKFCLDVGHAVCAANAQGIEPYAYVAGLARRFAPVMFHLSDVADMRSPYDAHPHLGTGQLDIPRLCREVFPRDARISIETVKDNSDDLRDFREDVVRLRAIFHEEDGRRHV